MTIPTIPPYEPSFKPVPTVTPFTYRDGVTMLKKLDNMVRYLNLVIVPFINNNLEALADEVEADIQSMIDQVNAAIDSVLNSSIEVQDAVVSGIFSDTESASRAVTDALYASHAALDSISNIINSGYLSEAALDAAYAPLTSTNARITTLENLVNTGRLSTTGLTSSIRSTVAPSIFPKFAKANSGNPVFNKTTQNPAAGALVPTTSNTIYFPCIIDAKKLFGAGALDEFYMYYSTDHEATHANSGIWLATGPSELGPWTGRGRVFIDNAGGTQTETPFIIADPTGTNVALMYYQQATAPGAVGSQSTLYATSNDGINWARGAIAIDIPTWWSSDGHTGYIHVGVHGNHLISHGLAGGTDNPSFGIARSYNGRNWSLDPEMLGYQMDLLQDGRRVEWNSGDVIVWKNRLYWIGTSSNFVSGSTTKDGRLIIAPINEVQNTLLSPPQVIFYPPSDSESTNYRATYTFIGRDGELYFYYQCDGKFFAATTKGVTQ